MHARLPSWLFAAALAVTLFFTPASAPAAIVANAPSTLSLQDVEDFAKNGIPDDKWPMLMETLGSADESNAARDLVRNLKPFPAAKLVELLAHPRLSVRLGALDLLEDAAGNTFGFDPWLEEATGANAESLAQWKTWAQKGKPTNKTPGGKLTEETFRVIALEIVSGQRERSERAMLRLQAYGLPAISYVEAFLQSQQDLGPAARAALKTAEYRLILQGALPKQAAALARGLAQGTPENQSSSLPELGHAGPTVLPIVADFLESPDPLVRETAVDAAFSAGGRHAVALIKPLLSKEKVESVLHAMIRGIGANAPDTATIQALEPFLKHSSENIIISTIEATSAANVTIFSGPISGCLTDSRWRVRAAALEAVKYRKMDDLKGKVVARLADEDLFVRVSAVGAYAAIAKDGNKLLLEHFQKHHDLKPAILAALLSSRSEIPESIWKDLAKAPPEIILQCLDTLESREDHDGKNIHYATPFATHPNADVAAAALRILSSYGRSTGLLLQALDSNDQVKQDAVLDGLHLPQGFFTDATVTVPTGTDQAASKLDEIYNAFSAAASPSTAKSDTPNTSDSNTPEASPSAMRATLVQLFQSGSARQKLRAALVLGVAGDRVAVRHLLSVYDILSGLDKRTCSGVLSTATDQLDDPRLELAIRLLRDPADDVRESAVATWLKYATPARISMLLDELVRPDALIHPDTIYTWEFARAQRQSGISAAVAEWSIKTLNRADAPDAVKVLALVMLSGRDEAQHATIAPFLDSKNPWLRRAAYHSLGLNQALGRLDQFLKDDSAHVRSVLPNLAAPEANGWKHFFDDSHYAEDEDDDMGSRRFSSRAQFGAWSETGSGQSTTTGSPEILAALEKLARDPSDLVRFEAQFALLRLGRPVDPSAFAALIRLQPEYSNASSRIGDFLESSHARLGKAYGVLVPLAKGVSASNQKKIFAHFGLSEEKAFASFAAIAKLSPATMTKADVAVAPPVAAPAMAATKEEFRVLFFFKTGCRDCERTRDLLQQLAGEFPHMILQERDITDPKAVVQNEVLSSRFQIASNLHQATPSVFTQEGALVRDDLNFAALASLLRKTAGTAPKAGWADVATPEETVADNVITQRYESFKLGAVIGAGLLDGINPCAFATIIFLLSYLQVARRSPGEILFVGLAFVSAVFLTYFAVGLGLVEVLNRLTAMRLAGVVLNYILAAFALMVAVLSFRDAQLAARGQVGEMTLQLPSSLKERIRYTIRTSSRSTRFVVAAFSAGIVVSLLELACTGQVYLPTIQYMIQGGRAGAMGYLLLYNLAFIIPLLIVFLLAWLGLRSEDLIRFQKRHTALVKVLTGVLFLCLTAFLLFGHDWFSLLPQK